jgi:phospholipid/cholesterol/gamma-HCH transport system permease protein
MISRVGIAAIAFLREISGLVWMIRESVSELGERVSLGKAPIRWSTFIEQAGRVGPGSVPLVVLVTLFFGLTMALLTGYQLQLFGLVSLVPAVVSVSFTRELGPLLTGIVLASRVGAAYTAELGSMVVSEEVEAIEGMGIGPLRFLVIPRVAAIVLLTPCLTVIADLAGIVGGALVSSAVLDISYAYFREQVIANLLVKDVISGIAKSILFGGIIGGVSCYKGLAVRGGAAGVGAATTSSVVAAITLVIICDSLCNLFLVSVLK